MRREFSKLLLLMLFAIVCKQANAAVLYSIGEPTDEEQLYVEYINRARTNPAIEGIRLAQSTNADVRQALRTVDTNLLISQFALIAPAPPLSINPALTIAARLHSGHMFTNVYQGHQGPGEIALGPRALLQGYDFSTLGENVFAFARSVEYGHAGFNVDWGTSSSGGSVGGMQDPPGHRQNIHDNAYKEIGVGVVNGTRTSGSATVGPQLVTQDMGSRFGITPFVTGVAYIDVNGNSFYDVGEGLGQVSVSVSGSTSAAVTSGSGGYSVPVTTNGNYGVFFTAPNFAGSNFLASIQNGQNRKIDLAIPYNPPSAIISGPLLSGQNNIAPFSPVPFADSYFVKQSRLMPYTGIEGAETSAGVTISSTAGYTVLDNSVKASGNFSFHLAHPQPVQDQTITFTNALRLKSDSSISFKSRLGLATDRQVATVQISTNNGQTWETVWSQAGTGDIGEATFKQVAVNLTGRTGDLAQFRLLYSFLGGGFFPQVESGRGWYVDDFAVVNAEVVSGTSTVEVNSNQFTFAPATAGRYVVEIRPRVNGRMLPGIEQELTALNGALIVRITSVQLIQGGQLKISFTSPGPQATLETRYSLSNQWTALEGIPIQAISSSVYEAVLPASATGSQFFRLRIDL